MHNIAPFPRPVEYYPRPGAGRDAGVAWRGQVFAVEGDPDVIARANDASDEE